MVFEFIVQEKMLQIKIQAYEDNKLKGEYILFLQVDPTREQSINVESTIFSYEHGRGIPRILIGKSIDVLNSCARTNVVSISHHVYMHNNNENSIKKLPHLFDEYGYTEIGDYDYKLHYVRTYKY